MLPISSRSPKRSWATVSISRAIVPYIGFVSEGTSSPSNGVWPVLSCCASLLGRNSRAWIAASTRASVCGRILSPRPFSTFETVLTETSAWRATSWIVGMNANEFVEPSLRSIELFRQFCVSI